MSNKFSQSLIYLIYTGATGFFFSLVFTVNQIYHIETVKLNPFQLVLVGTVLEASCFIFEIPTGIVADIKSRKLSVIIGLVLIGSAFIIEASIPLFIVVLLSQLLWGLGYTFTSGADQAWIAEEVGEENLDSIYLKGAQVSQFFSLMGIIVSTTIGAMIVNLPILMGGIFFVLLALFLMFFMKETNFTPIDKEDRSSFKQMIHTFSQGIKFINGKWLLMIMLGISLLHGLYSEGFDRLWTAHFLKNIDFPDIINLKPIVWIGLINGIAMILSIIAVEYIKRKMNKEGELKRVWILLIINIVMVLSIILLALSRNFSLAFSMYLTFYIVRTTNGPIYGVLLNKNIKSQVRATVISTYGQLDALGQIIGGPIIGLIALKTSIPFAMIISGVILSPVIALYLYVFFKAKLKIS
ncbi:MFS transporter [Dethiothermospora halolimnae]|uniref:MFS transporter n=1 Tax=Dethiothermospora halolimnae TaxID=3114390 RepID=UPI003CCC10EA